MTKNIKMASKNKSSLNDFKDETHSISVNNSCDIKEQSTSNFKNTVTKKKTKILSLVRNI